MREPLRRLWQAYAPAAAEYLRGGDEERLGRAYELGREALSSGLGLLDTAEIHREAMAAAASPASAQVIQRELELFAQALGPFEMALRGYQDAIGGLRRMASTLEGQVAERTREARAAESRFRSLVEHLPAVTYVAALEPAFALTYLSPQVERVLGYPVAAWLGPVEALRARVHPDDLARVAAHWSGEVAPGQRVSAEYRLLSQGGQVVWIRDEAVVLEADGEQPLRRQGFWVDITRQRALEDQLRQVQKMDAVGRLAGGVAHDFNNLLSVVLTLSELRFRELPVGDPLREDLEEIHKAGQRAASLTRQLLAFSRQQMVELKPLDLNAVVANMDKLLRRLIGEDVELVSLPAPGLAAVLADAGQLEQVVMNLAVNARDAMPRGGKLTIETANVELDAGYAQAHLGSKAGPHVMLAVSDTGVGMDKATQSRIFEPFFTTKGPGKGTGLGLSMVFGTVQQLGGSIWVYSEPEKGSTFKVYLPRTDQQAALAGPRPAPQADAGRRTILLVEDEEQVRKVARAILAREGYQVLEAPTPGEALALCARHEGQIHLLLTDVVMPQTSGRVLAEQVLALRPETRVLFMSGYTDEAVVRHGILEPGTSFLQKPLTPELLLRKVREALGG